MSKKIETKIQTQIEIINSKYPEIDKKIVQDIIFTSLGLRNVGFVPAFEIEKQIGLNKGYFSKAFLCGYDIRANIIKEDSNLLVKLDDEINRLLQEGYICCKIDKDESSHYDITINLTKNTLLGFYK